MVGVPIADIECPAMLADEIFLRTLEAHDPIKLPLYEKSIGDVWRARRESLLPRLRAEDSKSLGAY